MIAGLGGLLLGCPAPNPAYRATPVADGAAPPTDAAAPSGRGASIAPDAGEAKATGGSGGMPQTTTVSDPSRYNFERDAQDWHDLRGGDTAVTRSTTRSFAGAASLRVDLDVPTDRDGRCIGLDGTQVSVAPGTRVWFRFWLPADAALSAVQPYVMYWDGDPRAGGRSRWSGHWAMLADLRVGDWNDVFVDAPLDLVQLAELGVQFLSYQQPWHGVAFIDAVDW